MERFIINGGKKLSGKVRISGAKNSALKLIAASILANTKTTLRNVPGIEDVNIMLEMLETLGAKVNVDAASKVIEIEPENINSYEAPYELVRKMRASILVAGPLLSKFGKVKVAIPGGCNIGSRQIDLHLKGFKDLGAEYLVEHGYINCQIDKSRNGNRLHGNVINLDFPSRGATENIMMAACLASGQTVINNAAREPEISDLALFLNSMGAKIQGAGTDYITIDGVESLSGTDYEVMPDSIEAGTFITAAALCGERVEIENARWRNLEVFYSKLKEIGVNITIVDENNVRVEAPLERYKPVNISTLPYPGFPTDLQPIITVLLSVVPGVSIVTENVFENRFMYVDELNRMGADIKIEGHHAVIRGVEKLSGAPVRSFDLRAGAAVVLAGLIAEGPTEVSDIYHIKRGYENFDEKLRLLGADIRLVE
ncbi:MAG: UDP-N-acetylglucosamine 1-carboxyvinyltransferase [Candidatus Humimicrobiaceae bacterium]|jgi:UDP-N-acetylglucosamine 1-carboxyvinyltransferase|nr:UDP-N-acetylglucosamine 1-carboxyvinyltransferase [Actinomycetota bacterium]MDD5600443.1 UDP-N-acetylglucosamine 1-carboxyvinyltransferase [Actinomycetota bacterium]MDY0027518.1 UDP-N-acetylglucosamine 1-carboxyvinyltransferase [Candidatus Humimicrobiaceae bacterium]